MAPSVTVMATARMTPMTGLTPASSQRSWRMARTGTVGPLPVERVFQQVHIMVLVERWGKQGSPRRTSLRAAQPPGPGVEEEQHVDQGAHHLDGPPGRQEVERHRARGEEVRPAAR